MSYRKRGANGFIRGLLIYICIFALLAAAALTVLTLYLNAYEQSRPGTAVRSYLREAQAGRLDYSWGYTLAQMDRRVQTEEEALAFARELLSGCSSRELLGDTEGLSRFGLYDAQGHRFAELTLTQTGESHWGFSGWEVSAVSIQLAPYTHSLSLTLPTDYSVSLDGKTLDESFIVESGIDYALLAPCAELVSPLPQMQRWELGPCLRELRVTVRDGSGREVREEELSEQRFLDNCTKEEQEALRDFIESYLEVYLPYAGDLNRGGIGWWGELSHMVVRGGELEERLVQARKGFGFGNTKSIKILSFDYVLFSNLQDGHYLVDLSYVTETEGLNGKVEEENHVRLLIVQTEKRLLTEAMYTY